MGGLIESFDFADICQAVVRALALARERPDTMGDQLAREAAGQAIAAAIALEHHDTGAHAIAAGEARRLAALTAELLDVADPLAA